MREQRTGERLAAAQDQTDRRRQRKEPDGRLRRQEESGRQRQGPGRQGAQDGALGAVPPRQPPHPHRARRGQDLHQQHRDDQRRLVQPELLGAVDGRLADHRLHAVVVDEIGEEEGQGERMTPHLAQGAAQLAPALAERRAAGLVGRGAAGRPPVAQPAQRDQREAAPPQPRRRQADAHGGARGDAEGVVPGVERQVGDEDQRAGRVAERPAPGGDRIALVGLGYLRQKGVVEHHRDDEAHIRDDQQRPAEQIAVAAQEEHPGRRRGTRIRTGAQQRFLAAGPVDQRPGDRHRQHRHQQRRGDRVREEGTGPHGDAQGVDEAVRIRRGLRHRGQIRPEEDRQDARGIDAVRPVVPVPAALLPASGPRLRIVAPDHGLCLHRAHPRRVVPVAGSGPAAGGRTWKSRSVGTVRSVSM